MAVLTITDCEDPGNLARIELWIDKNNTRSAKWRCLTLGALNDRPVADNWHDASVAWSVDFRDAIATEVVCYVDYWDDGQPLPVLEFEGVYNDGILSIVESGNGRIVFSRCGFLAEGDMTWRR